MGDLLHRIKVFLFRRGPEPHYLLLKPDQGLEALWGPVQGNLGFGDKMESAARRRVYEGTGLQPPGRLLDLGAPVRWTLGDEQVIEWCYGLGVRDDPDPVALERHYVDHRWAPLADAYPRLGLQFDRTAILRLHALLEVA